MEIATKIQNMLTKNQNEIKNGEAELVAAAAELVDLYNSEKQLTGIVSERGKHPEKGSFMLVVHMCIINSLGQMLIQRRSLSKENYPGKWDVSAGGFAKAGETSQEAVIREANEELGIRIADQSDLRFLFSAPISYVFDDFYLCRSDISLADLKLLDSEICDAKWADKAEIISMIKDGRFVDYDVEIINRVYDICPGVVE